jgi:CheY-like chemotaxis protein
MEPAKILIADDSLLMHKLLKAMLPGTSVVDALDGCEALARLAEHPDVDLIILDINMPNMSGLELVDRLRADGMLAKVAVLVMTTEGMESNAIACLRAGAAGFLRKPFQHRQMLDLIARL